MAATHDRTYDVVVLGAGPGGYVAAIRAAQLGLNTAVVEPKYWGGVCLNVGCIPSKALLRNAELAHIFTKEAKQFGISGEATFDYGVAFDRSRKVAEGRVAGVHFLMKKNKITEINGYGKFKDDHTLEVDLNEGDTETVTFDNIIIATGSSTKLVPGTSLSDNVVTYEKLIMTREWWLWSSSSKPSWNRWARRARSSPASTRSRSATRPRSLSADGQ